MKAYTALFVCVWSIFLLSLSTLSTEAQTISQNNIHISTQPDYPEPFEEVTANLDAYSVSLLGATIAWYVDGAEDTECKNSHTCSVTTGERGSSLNITALITLANGQTKSAQHTITPARVDVIIEADTKTPLFYRGRALPSSGSTIRAIALPFTNTPSSRLTYTWALDGRVLFGGPVMGKDVAEFAIPFNGSGVISVAVADTSGKTFTKKSVEVRTVEPLLRFYEENPLRGLSRVALPGTYQLIGDEMTVRAEPYYMNADLSPTHTQTEWEINGTEVENPNNDPQTITLRSGGGTGSFDVSLQVRNLNELLQEAAGSFTVRF